MAYFSWADALDAAAKGQAAADAERDEIDLAHTTAIRDIAKAVGLEVYELGEVVDKVREKAAEIERLRALNHALESMLACYRTGRRPSESLLDTITKLKGTLDNTELAEWAKVAKPPQDLQQEARPW